MKRIRVLKSKWSFVLLTVIFVMLTVIIAVVSYFIGQNTAYTGIVLPYFAFDKKFLSYGGNGSGNYICHGKAIVHVQANGEALVTNKPGIDAGVSNKSDELDKINMQIGGTPYGTSLKFDVNTNVNAPDYTITENDDNILSAYNLTKSAWSDKVNNITAINIFTLNKKTGIAVWSYLSPQYLFSSNPGGSIENLLCD
jgi:hypothetical protein